MPIDESLVNAHSVCMKATDHNAEAANLIALSIAGKLRGRVGYSQGLHAALVAACDDYTETNEGWDYWAISPDCDDEMVWRVELATPGHGCAYCGATLEGDADDPVPAVDSDEWDDLAAEHATGCEWVETRAHRIEAA